MKRNSVLTKEPHKSKYSQWRKNALLSVSLECSAEEQTNAEENRGSQATTRLKLVMPHFVGLLTMGFSLHMCNTTNIFHNIKYTGSRNTGIKTQVVPMHRTNEKLKTFGTS